MKKRLTLFLTILFAVGYLASPGLSQTADEILAKMIEAQGGREKLASVKDMTASGSLEMISMGLSGSFTRYQKEPNKMRMDIEIMGMVITQAYDGETAWAVNPQTGSTEEMPEQAAEYFKRDALGNDSLLNPSKYGITFTFMGKEEIEGKEYLILEQTFSDGFKALIYIDPETYLPYKTKSKTLNQMGVEVEAETILEDYKPVEGMMTPHTLTVFQDGEEFITITITEISYNTGLEDSLFQMSG